MADRLQEGPHSTKTEPPLKRLMREYRACESSDTRWYRLQFVVKFHMDYSPDLMRDLTDGAIAWTAASVAVHPRSTCCHDYFFSMIDMTYCLSDQHCLESDLAREEIYATANELYKTASSTLASVVKESLHSIGQLEKTDIVRQCVESLFFVRAQYLEHISSYQCTELISFCAWAGAAADMVRRGTMHKDELKVRCLWMLCLYLGELRDGMLNRIRDGQPAVKDGRTIDPIRELKQHPMVTAVIRDTTACLMAQPGMTPSEAIRIATEMAEHALNSARERTADPFETGKGDRYLADELRNPAIHAESEKRRAEGATDDDIRWWHNLSAFEQEVIHDQDNADRLTMFATLLQRGLTPDEAGREVHKRHATFGLGENESQRGEDRPLAWELKGRVLAFIERHYSNADELKRLTDQSTSFNALVRSEMRAGRL